MRLSRFLVPALAVGLAAPCASAQTPGAGSAEGWSFSVTPYAWFAGISGDATLRDRTDSGSADFGDIFDDLKFAFMGMAEARYGRFGLVADMLYLDLEQGVSTPHGIAFSGGSGTVTATGTGFVALVRVVEDPRGTLDIGGGIRPWWVDTKLRLNPGLAAGRSFSKSSNWTDPIVAVRGNLPLGPQFGISAYGDIGGFGAGSELTWQVIGTVDWRPYDWLSLHAGWRYLSLDFDKGGASLDVGIGGPIFGATFRL